MGKGSQQWWVMLYLRYGNMEIKKQTQVFVTVSYYFRMQEQKEIADVKTNIR